jgi:hypothetical protein
MVDYAEGKIVGIAYAEGKTCANGQTGLRRGASTPRVALSIDYADGHCALRWGLSAIGIAIHCYSDCIWRGYLWWGCWCRWMFGGQTWGSLDQRRAWHFCSPAKSASSSSRRQNFLQDMATEGGVAGSHSATWFLAADWSWCVAGCGLPLGLRRIGTGKGTFFRGVIGMGVGMR